jgi:phosphatidylglycerophosphate synthase
MQKIRQMVPWAMAAGRGLLVPVISLGDRCGWSGFTLAAMVVTALLSDIFDGVLARRWRVDTAAVRLFDSMSDAVFYICVGVALWLFQPQLLGGNFVLVGVLLAIEAANFAANFAKYGRPASYHSYLAKTWGLLLATAIAAAFATDHAAVLMRVALWMGIASNIETIAMSLMLPVWRRDVKTIAEAWRLRKEICGAAAQNLGATSAECDCGRLSGWVERAITWVATGVIAGLSLMATSAFAAQSQMQAGQTFANETQARGYWIDPSTGLMWAAKDNGKNSSYYDSTKYCRKLRLAGYSDWRLATTDELKGIYDVRAEAPGLAAGPGEQPPFLWHVKGGLFLTGLEWSSDRGRDSRGRPSGGGGSYFDFCGGQVTVDQLGYYVGKRALCVRSASPVTAGLPAASAQRSQPLVQETQARGYWIDPATTLMWAAKDNGKDVSWHKAMKYCRDLRLAGFSDWRLATIDELQGLYDAKKQAPGLTGPGDGRAVLWHVRGGLFLTGIEWSNNPGKHNGHSPGAEWFFNFNDGQRASDQTGYAFNKRALCVRHD